MDTFTPHLETEGLWRVQSFGTNERMLPNTWWENKGRPPVGVVCVQYVIAGEMFVRVKSQEAVVPAGSAVLFTSFENSAYGLNKKSGLGCTSDWLALAGAGLLNHWALLRSQFGSVIPLGPDIRSSMHRLIELDSAKSRKDAIAMAAVVHAFVLQLFTDAQESVTTTQSPVDQAVAALLRHPTASWSLQEVAKTYKCSREHLTRVFQRRVGVSPGQWQNQQRLAKAMNLLRHSYLPVSLIATQSGFSSPHAMARQVRSKTGMSPLAYQRGSKT